jgi:hypothetical protein
MSHLTTVKPGNCSTGDPDTGGNCTACVEYRRLRVANRRERGVGAR